MTLHRQTHNVPAGQLFRDREVLSFSHDDLTIRIPTLIAGRYVIDTLLALGGMGAVFVATDRKLRDRPVLVKMARYDTSKCFRERYVVPNIAEIVSRGRTRLHEEMEHLVTLGVGVDRLPTVSNFVYDYGPQLHGPHQPSEWYWSEGEDKGLLDEEPYLVMQYIAGRPLSDLLVSGDDVYTIGPVGSPERAWYVCGLGRELCTVLSELHKSYVLETADGRECYGYQVYQDLKPQNVIRTPLGDHYVIDLGAIGYVNVDGSSSSFQGEMLSTHGYQAPECVRERSITDLSDVYSLGVTLFEAATRIHKDTARELRDAVATAEMQFREFPYPVLWETIKACLHTSADDRADAIQGFAADEFVASFRGRMPTATEILRERFRLVRRQGA